MHYGFAHEIEEGDAFSFGIDTTVWVATEITGYSDGSTIVHANGPTVGVVAVFTLDPVAQVVFK